MTINTKFYCRCCTKDYIRRLVLITIGNNKEIYKCRYCGTCDIFPYEEKKGLINNLKIMKKKGI